jgi:hypothetical protein
VHRLAALGHYGRDRRLPREGESAAVNESQVNPSHPLIMCERRLSFVACNRHDGTRGSGAATDGMLASASATARLAHPSLHPASRIEVGCL